MELALQLLIQGLSVDRDARGASSGRETRADTTSGASITAAPRGRTASRTR
jgi:hypothetical protein